VIGLAIVLGLTMVFHWEKLLMTSGMNTYFGSNAPPSSGVDRKMDLVFFHEDAQGGMTTVLEFTTPSTGEKDQVLFSNGKFEGSDNLQIQGLAQIGIAAIPSLYTHNFDRALLIGLGTGHSALALSQAGYGQIEIAEFAPGIIEAAQTRFARLDQGVLKSPKVKLEVEDGRHVLLAGRGKGYDLIAVEIASIWFAGATNVYSREFYELARNRLRPGGALQQWVQFHHISSREIATTIATVRSVFPYVSVWYAGRQGIIVATMEPQIGDAAREAMLVQRLGSLASQDLVREILHSRVADPKAVDRLIAAERSPVNTDSNRWIEYATPRYNVTSEDWTTQNLAWLRRY
jgi:spermidine synthase